MRRFLKLIFCLKEKMDIVQK